MNRKSKIALVALIAVGIAASATYWLRVGEPVYRGRTASQWFEEIEIMPGGGIVHEDEAAQALVAMGGDAAPYLMKQLEYALQPSRAREFIARILQRIPWLQVRPMTATERYGRAYITLMVMGPKAQQAIPELLRLGQDARFRSRYQAITLIGYIHSRPELTLPVLTRMLDDTDKMVKMSAARALGKYGRSATAASPTLRQMLTDQDAQISLCAATALVGIGESLELALPIISNVLTDPSSPSRRGLVFMLGELGEKAKPTVPLLTEGLRDANADFRGMVTSVNENNPPRSTQAGVKNTTGWPSRLLVNSFFKRLQTQRSPRRQPASTDQGVWAQASPPARTQRAGRRVPQLSCDGTVRHAAVAGSGLPLPTASALADDVQRFVQKVGLGLS